MTCEDFKEGVGFWNFIKFGIDSLNNKEKEKYNFSIFFGLMLVEFFWFWNSYFG